MTSQIRKDFDPMTPKQIYFLEILKKARKENRPTITKEELEPFWKQFGKESQKSLDAIRQKRTGWI